MQVVHHSNYFCWYEVARFDFAREILGITAEDLLSHQIVIPILHTQTHHFHPARMDDELVICTRMGLYETARFACHHDVVDASTGRLLAQGNSEHAFLKPDWKPYLAVPQLFAERVCRAQERYPDWFATMSNANRGRLRKFG